MACDESAIAQITPTFTCFRVSTRRGASFVVDGHRACIDRQRSMIEEQNSKYASRAHAPRGSTRHMEARCHVGSRFAPPSPTDSRQWACGRWRPRCGPLQIRAHRPRPLAAAHKSCQTHILPVPTNSWCPLLNRSRNHSLDYIAQLALVRCKPNTRRARRHLHKRLTGDDSSTSSSLSSKPSTSSSMSSSSCLIIA